MILLLGLIQTHAAQKAMYNWNELLGHKFKSLSQWRLYIEQPNKHLAQAIESIQIPSAMITNFW